MLVVWADDYTNCTVQSVNAVLIVLDHLYKGQRASVCVPAEDRYCVIRTASGVDMLVIRADSHTSCSVQSVNGVACAVYPTVLEHLYKG